MSLLTQWGPSLGGMRTSADFNGTVGILRRMTSSNAIEQPINRLESIDEIRQLAAWPAPLKALLTTIRRGAPDLRIRVR